MKKVFGKIRVLITVVAFVLVMCACGNLKADKTVGEKNTDVSQSYDSEEESYDKNEETEKIERGSSGAPKIEEIEWDIDEGIVDGERKVVLSLANNSEYVLAGFDISFTEKNDITDEEKEAFYNSIKEKFDASDDDIEQLKSRVISMHAETERVINPGDSITNADIYYYQGYYYMKDLDHYSLVTPDIAEISYVDGEKIYKEYYDFKSKKYSMDSKSEEAKYWTKSVLGTVVPKPDVPVLKEDGRDDDDCFMFAAYGMTFDDFSLYVESCRNNGYTVDPSEFNGYYSADNSDGYSVRMNYYEDKFCTNVKVTAPDEDKNNNEQDISVETEEEEEDSEPEVDIENVTSSVKETLDEYEDFFDKYVVFMKKYKNADSGDLTKMMEEYSDFLDKYTDIYGKFVDMAGDMDITSDDYKYYMRVWKRIEQKLQEV